MSLALALRLGPWLAILMLLGVVAFQNDKIHDWHQQSDRCAEARKADRATYEAAQAEAARKNAEQVQKIEQKQQEKTDAAKRAYDADLARLRAGGVRQQGTPAAKGAPGQPGASGVPSAPGGADGAPQVCVSAPDALSSAETELRLWHLQQWIAEQLQVER
jgi:hypothetical protein